MIAYSPELEAQIAEEAAKIRQMRQESENAQKQEETVKNDAFKPPQTCLGCGGAMAIAPGQRVFTHKACRSVWKRFRHEKEKRLSRSKIASTPTSSGTVSM